MLTVIFSKEEDIATYTIKVVDDPRTLNKVLHIRPPANILSFNEIVSLWEKKIGKTLEKTYLLEDQLLKKIQGQLEQFHLLIYSVFLQIEFGFGSYTPSSLRHVSFFDLICQDTLCYLIWNLDNYQGSCSIFFIYQYCQSNQL